MKVTSYIYCMLAFTCLIHIAYSERSQNKLKRHFSDDFTTNEMLKIKRPFCNAFTGCGKKRSFYGSLTGPRDISKMDNTKLPLFLYKMLLTAASRDMENTVNGDSDNYEFPEIIQDYTVYPNQNIPFEEGQES